MNGARSATPRAEMLAMARSNSPAPASGCGTDPWASATCACSRSRRKFRRAAVTACGSMSKAATRPAPSRSAAMDRIPEPVPKSSAAIPGRVSSSSASRQV